MRSGRCSRIVTNSHTDFKPSPALLEAQERLEQLRNKIQAGKKAPDRDALPAGQTADHRPDRNSVGAGVAVTASELGTLPPHLGWFSQAVTEAVRADRRRRAANEPNGEKGLPDQEIGTISHPPENSDRAPQNRSFQPGNCPTVKVYPDIALGMLRQGEAAPGRIWLLLRYLDQEGRGWLRIDIVKDKLTSKTSKLRICGWRQLRKLLNGGEGIFWARDNDRIWLRSVARVAAALEVERLTGKPVATAVAGLLQGMGDARAHLYASFHSGRVKESAPGPGGMPVARATLERVTGVCRRSQRAYEQRAGIEVQHNFAIGELDSLAEAQQRAWQQGYALFKLKDYRGQQGRKGDDYLAWQIPNSYSGCQRQLPKGRQRRINRELADLFVREMTGNSKRAYEKRYFANGKLAAEIYNRDPRRDLYWPGPKTARGRHRVWRIMAGRG